MKKLIKLVKAKKPHTFETSNKDSNIDKKYNKYSIINVENTDSQYKDKMPDIYEFLADINNSDIKTPTWLANKMLDALPKEIWSNEKIKFLDPCVKSGVFLREIVKRLDVGLSKKIPDKFKRISHIFKEQVFGIALEEIGSLIAKRSLYCARKANDELRSCAISEAYTDLITPPKMVFENEDGNIHYKRCQHIWVNKNGENVCKICGARESQFGDKATTLYADSNKREAYLDKKGNPIYKDNHCYEFIHTQNPERIFNMKFDVIIGNPPYNMSDQSKESESANKSSAKAIYHKFVMQALKLDPKYLVMIIPSRWMSGAKGEGIKEFRKMMIDSTELSIVHDFEDHRDCFPNAFVVGGIMYFLWDKNKQNKEIKWFTHKPGDKKGVCSYRTLNADDSVIIREKECDDLKTKILLANKSGMTFDSIVLERNPFNIPSNFSEYNLQKENGSIKFYTNSNKHMVEGWLPKNFNITKGGDYINKYKVLISKAIYTSFAGQAKYGLRPFIAQPNSCSSETYLLICPNISNEMICKNIISYMKTNFFYFLLSIAKLTHNTSKKDFQFIPLVDFNEEWDDEKLNRMFNLTKDEIELINKYSPERVK